MEQKVVKGYKVFNTDWTCRGFQYEVGESYEIEEPPICCTRGFHFCEKLSDCFNHYWLRSDNKVAEIESYGDISKGDGGESCTNKIRIIRELTWHEVLDLCNSGRGNSGSYNSGDYNSGDYNSGDYNSGNDNSGYGNSGHNNLGNRNSGHNNLGDGNSGDGNLGDGNSGDWNSCNSSGGVFNTKESKIYMFNRQSDWNLTTWHECRARHILDDMPMDCLSWIPTLVMDDNEKKNNPTHETTGGYLKLIKMDNRQEWWDKLSMIYKEEVLSLPNFDKAIFKEITGIDVGDVNE